MSRLFLLVVLTLILVLPVHSEQYQPRLIKPIHEELTEPIDKQDANQCAGTMDRHRFEPTGYKPRRPDKNSAKGKLLYEKLKCMQCHSIEGRGGEVGPPLDGIGGHRGPDWLKARLLDPQRQMKEYPTIFGGKPNIMPHVGVSKREANLLSDYILTLAEPKAGFLVNHHADRCGPEVDPGNQNWQPHPESEASRNGKELFSSLYCGACHSVDGSKDRFGPDLAGIGSRLSESKLEKVLAGAVRSAVMKKQAARLGDERIFDIKAFLLTLPAECRNNSDAHSGVQQNKK